MQKARIGMDTADITGTLYASGDYLELLSENIRRLPDARPIEGRDPPHWDGETLTSAARL
jgi:hypothetical protein